MHRQVVALLSALPIGEQTPVLQDWQAPLLKEERVFETKVTMSPVAPPTKHTFTGYEALKEEAKRLYPDVVNVAFSVADA